MILNKWEQNNIEVLTSREMGEWLGRRENRLLEQIRAEIERATIEMDYDTAKEALNVIDKYKGRE